MTDAEMLREILDFSGHKFPTHLDGQQIIAVVSAIELAGRHPGFHGPSKVLADRYASDLKQLATRFAPELDLLAGIWNLGWIPGEELCAAHRARAIAPIYEQAAEDNHPHGQRL